MKIWLMSDLHIDSAPYAAPSMPKGADVIVVAGDVADGHQLSASWLANHLVPLGLPVVVVAGNHDYYGHDLTDDAAALHADCGVVLLTTSRPKIELAGARLVGASLWTDYRVSGDMAEAQFWARRSMPDFAAIDVGMRRLRPSDLSCLHQQHRDVIERELREPFEGPTIVVSHHAPHPKSLRSDVERTPSDGSFASDLEDLIRAHRPDFWLHGHVHHSRDYQVGRTRVICNPRGYSVSRRSAKRGLFSLENPSFDPQCIIEV